MYVHTCVCVCVCVCVHVYTHMCAFFTDPIPVIRQLNVKQVVATKQTIYTHKLKTCDRTPNNTI